MTNYLTRTKSALLDENLDGVEDPLLKLGITEAIRYSGVYQVRHWVSRWARKFTASEPPLRTLLTRYIQNSAVSLALSIRAASYFSRTRMVMAGPNVLEMPYFGDSRVLINGGSPIPSVLDYQVDYLAIRYMLGCMKQIIHLLKKLIFTQSAQKRWYEIHLATFVLLSSLESVHERQIQISRRFEVQVIILLEYLFFHTDRRSKTFC